MPASVDASADVFRIAVSWEAPLKDCGKMKTPMSRRTWASPDVPGLEAFTTTRLRTPQGFTHRCTSVHTTPPKTEGTKQESNPCTRITTQLVLPEVYQRHQASVGPKQRPSLPLITAITLLEQRRAFSANIAGPS